jgi:hypothetical protein
MAWHCIKNTDDFDDLHSQQGVLDGEFTLDFRNSLLDCIKNMYNTSFE